MKKRLQDMFTYLALILAICFIAPMLYQKIKPKDENQAVIIKQQNKYSISERYDAVFHYKGCVAGAHYEAIATIWLMEGNKKVIQKVSFQYVAEDTTGDVHVITNISEEYKNKKVSAIFSTPKICE